MRYLLIVLLLVISLNSNGQYKIQPIPVTCFFLAGSCRATTDILRSDYTSFQRVFPKADPQFWDYNISWTNKYKNGDPSQGPRFWQSTGLLSPLTDGFHMVEMPRKYLPIIAVSIKLGDKNRPFKYYIYDGIIYSAAYGLGFNLFWKIIYKKN